MSNKLYGSSATKDGIKKIIGDFWYRSDVELTQVEGAKKETYNINLGAKLITDFIVVKVGKRYRFEEVI